MKLKPDALILFRVFLVILKLDRNLNENMKMIKKSQNGFSLIELMIVIVVIGILAAIAVPSYEDYKQKSRRSDATSMLLQQAANQEQFFMDNRRYAADFTELGYGTATITSDGGYYNLAITLNGNFFYTLTATPVAGGQQAGDSDCASFTLDSNGSRGSTGHSTACW